MPLEEYLYAAVADFREGRDNADPSQWQSPLFFFIRLVKAHPAMAAATANQAIQQIEKVMKIWRRELPPEQAHLDDDWEVWLDVSREDAHAEFYDAWDKVRYLPGYDPLENAVEHASRCPLRLPEALKENRPEVYERFISIVGWLQVGMGNQNILVPVKKFAEILNVATMTISRFRKWAKEDGFLTEVESYQFHGKGKQNKATEFRFDVSRCSILEQKAAN